MEFIGELITHKVFGVGKITELNESCIKIKFNDIEEEKDFIYPDALDSYLELTNKVLSKQVESELADYRLKKAERIKREGLKKEALRSEKARLEKSKTRAKKAVIKDFDSNIVYKCNYCDGGSTNGSMGYKGVC
ncbi:MAG: hypothetical protein ACERLG_10645, partial [Sedimentibacter sp.]